jgi:sugar/nucleoside kinase (ribokinase family)
VNGSRNRLDVVGLGALNVDYIASASSLTKRMADHVIESVARFEGNVEGRTSEEVILAVIDQLGTSSLQTALGGSAWNTMFALGQLQAGARFVHVTSLLDADSPAQQPAVLTRAKELNPAMQITFDPGHDWAVNPTEAVLGILRLADFVFVNFREFKALGHYRHGQLDAEVARSLLGRCAPGAAVLVTKRYDFVEVFRPGRPGPAVEQIRLALPFTAEGALEDATGAGDIFSAAVLAALASREIQVELGCLLGLSLARHRLQGSGLPALTGGFLQIRESLTRQRPRRPSGVFLSGRRRHSTSASSSRPTAGSRCSSWTAPRRARRSPTRCGPS